MEFRKITLEDKDFLCDKCKSYDEALGWECDFGMMWCWNVFDSTLVAQEDDITYVHTIFYDKLVFFPPYISGNSDINVALTKMELICHEKGVELDVRGIPKFHADKIDTTRFEVTTDRNNYDYIYMATDLIELSGKKLHSKRNFVNRFTSSNNFAFREYADADFDAVIELYDMWAKLSGSADELEKVALTRALKSWRELGLIIPVIVIGDKIVAYSVSSIYRKKLAHTYFEKADSSYPGIYQALNNMVAKKYFADCIYVNRQEDMGIEGLRKAKESYHPALMFEKYSVKSISK